MPLLARGELAPVPVSDLFVPAQGGRRKIDARLRRPQTDVPLRQNAVRSTVAAAFDGGRDPKPHPIQATAGREASPP
jgi:hypothetical protein